MVAADAAEQTHRVPLTFPNGRRSTFPVLVAEPGSLRAAFDNVGTSPDPDRATGDFDGGGWSYSREALPDAGVTPGGKASGTLTVSYTDGSTQTAEVFATAPIA